MGIEKYRITPTPLERYYDVFLQNFFKRAKYIITLRTGESLTGIPTVGSFINPMDPNASFQFDCDDGNSYRIPFSELTDVGQPG